jgi:hypothetical protein
LTSEQLQHVRAERWRQASNPILTSDDAKAWIEGIGFCLFLPRRSHFAAPAPSFVEAVTGTPTELPSRDAIQTATELLHRLTANGDVIPLNLFSAAAGGVVSDQPDFLVTREALPYAFSLIGGRNWKSSPGQKATPLMTEVWTLLNGESAFSAQEIQSALGRELTEAAVLRALVELWNGLRVIPVYDGGTTRWELTQARFAAEMTASQKVAQATALSALASLYLESVVAASSEEIETFLSPLASRSRVREVVNGLSATRQIGMLSVAAQPLFHVAGMLPEFADEEPITAEPHAPVGPGGERSGEGFVRKPRPSREQYSERKPFERGTRPPGRSGRPSERSGHPDDRRPRPAFDRGRTGTPRERTGPPRERSGPPRERTGFAARDTGRRFSAPRSSEAGDRPYRRPEDRRPGDRKPFGGERKPFGKKPFDKSARPSGSRPPSASRPYDRERPRTERPRTDRPRPAAGAGSGDRPPRKFSGARPWQDRGSAGRPTERPFRPRREEGSGGERSGERRTGAPGGEKRFGGPKKFGAPKKFGGPKKFDRPKFGGAKSGERSSSGSRPYSRPGPRSDSRTGPRPPRSSSAGRGEFSRGPKRETPGEKRPFFRERPPKSADGESRPRTFRSSGDAGPAKRSGDWKPKSSSGGFSRKPSGGGYSPKPSGGGYSKSGKPGFKSSGKPAFKSGGKPAYKKSGFGKSAKPFGKSTKPPGKGGKPAFGKKPGGFKPPYRKRKDEGGKNAE